MVYAGKPSKACERCRTRRSKCGLQRPSCSQCEKARVHCPGYRDAVDVLFCNQTKAVIKKHANAGKIDDPVSRERGPVTRDSDTGLYNFNVRSVMSEQLANSAVQIHNQSIDQTATSYLLTSFFDGSHFYYVPKMYISTTHRSLFQQTVHALAFAAFSYRNSQPELLPVARTCYAESICRLKAAISSADGISSDETLAAALLLSRFESFTGDSSEETISESWSRHVLGALAILELRMAKERVTSPVSAVLFNQTIHHGNLHYYKKKLPRPQCLVKLGLRRHPEKESGSKWDLDEHRMQLHQWTDTFCEFRRNIETKLITDDAVIITSAKEIERKIFKFLVNIGGRVSYTTIECTENDRPRGYKDAKIHQGSFHVYKNHYEARIWNTTRMIRAALHECIIHRSKILQLKRSEGLTHTSEGEGWDLASLIKESEDEIVEIVKEICASVPQYLRKGYPDCTPATVSFLIWPLYVAGRVAPHLCKDFVKDRLEWIVREMRISNAEMAVKALEKEFYRDDWLHTSHIF